MVSLLLALALAPEPEITGTGHLTLGGLPPVCVGGQAVLGLTDFPVRLGVAGGLAPRYAAGWAAWVEGGGPLADGLAAGVLIGANQRWDPGTCTANGPACQTGLVPARIGFVLGGYAAYWLSNQVWVRVTPHLTLVPQDALQPPQAAFGTVARWPDGALAIGPRAQAPLIDAARSLIAGPPWLEVGWVVAPHVVLSLRTTLAPIALTIGI